MSLNYSPKTSEVKNQYLFQSVSKNSGNNNSPSPILELVENWEIVKLQKQRTVDIAGLPASNKKYQAIYFALSDDYTHIKGLFNGLISLGQPKGVKLEIQRELNQYVLKFYHTDENIATAYFEKLVKMADGELRFKSVLKRLLENQKAFDASQQLLKKEIFK